MSAASVQEKSAIKIKLSVVKGPHLGQIFFLNKPSFTIGRGAENDIILMNDPLISRTHAQIDVVDRDLEIKNLSSKNAILIDGESVQQWKIVSNSNFRLGDSELLVEYDFGKSVAVVSPAKNSNILPLKPKSNLQNLASPPAGKVSEPLSRQSPVDFLNYRSDSKQQQGLNTSENSKLINYLIALVLVGGLLFYFLKPNKSVKVKKTSVLRYEDAAKIKALSSKEMEREEERETRIKERDKSPQDFRIRESLVRGMRDFHLGNYVRAQESFQLVLNLDPDHPLAKRYSYLSRVRFDEIVQEKLMLGESYFKKHNFGMCESLYRQVIDMLSGKNNDSRVQLASRKARQCQLAAEGIR